MEKITYKYDVYISYADSPKDKRIAAKLQKLLQGHRTAEPAGDKGGKKHARRLQVFKPPVRATAPNTGLDENSCQALAQSRYMVLLCSNASKKSVICRKELDFFRKLHGESNKNILLLLLEGKPLEVFPEQLWWERHKTIGKDGQENLQMEKVEPLAANIVGSDREMIKLLRKEYLRLAAPVLGCEFDELYQRKQRKQRRRFRVAFAMILMASICFWGYSSHMLKQLAEKQKKLDAHEALRLAFLSKEICQKGDYRLAMLLAKQALSKNKEDSESQMATQAETALRCAVMGQMLEQDKPLILQASIPFNVTSWFICDTYADGTRIAVSDYDNTYLYDTMTGKLLFQCQGVEVYFDENAEKAVRITELFDGKGTVLKECFQVQTGELLFSKEVQKGVDEQAHAYKDYRNPAFTSVLENADYLADDGMLPDGNSTGSDTGLSEIAEMREIAAFLEESYLFTARTGIDTGDGELFIYSNSDEPSGNFFWSRKEQRVIARLYGNCYFDRNSHLIYQTNGTGLCIYSYAPENFAAIRLTDSNVRISKDGKKLLTIKVWKESEDIHRTIFQIWTVDSLSSPMLEMQTVQEGYFSMDNYLYYLTPNMDKIFYEDAEGNLCLQEVGGEITLLLRPEPEQETTSLSIDERGQRLAAAMKHEDGSVSVLLYFTDGSPIGKLELEKYGDILVSHMEFNGDHLLVCTQDQSMLFDLTGKEKTKIFEHGNQQFHQDRYLTKDGLLICTMETNSFYCLSAIYDIETGTELFEEVECRAYQYQEDTGTLVYQKLGTANVNNSIYIARRSEDGAFKNVCTVASQEVNMMLRIDDCTMDSRYFLVNGDNCCEVYDIFSGERVLTCNGTEYALIDGVLYNLNSYVQDRVARYQVMGLDELNKCADRYLISENGMRELTELEKEIYFITNN